SGDMWGRDGRRAVMRSLSLFYAIIFSVVLVNRGYAGLSRPVGAQVLGKRTETAAVPPAFAVQLQGKRRKVYRADGSPSGPAHVVDRKVDASIRPMAS